MKLEEAIAKQVEEQAEKEETVIDRVLSEEAMARHREEEEEVEYQLKVSKLRHAIKRERSMVKRWELEKDLDELEWKRFLQLKKWREEEAKREAEERKQKEYSGFSYGLSERDEREYREQQARERAEKAAASRRREEAAKKARLEAERRSRAERERDEEEERKRREADIQYKMRKAAEFKLEKIEDDALVNDAFAAFGKATTVEDVFSDVKIEEPKRSSRRSKKTSKKGGDDPESFFTSMMYDIAEEEEKEQEAVSNLFEAFDWGFGW